MPCYEESRPDRLRRLPMVKGTGLTSTRKLFSSPFPDRHVGGWFAGRPATRPRCFKIWIGDPPSSPSYSYSRGDCETTAVRTLRVETAGTSSLHRWCHGYRVVSVKRTGPPPRPVSTGGRRAQGNRHGTLTRLSLRTTTTMNSRWRSRKASTQTSSIIS